MNTEHTKKASIGLPILAPFFGPGERRALNMPNWCNNSLVITHKDEGKLESLYEIIKEYDETKEGEEKPAFFGKILPEPVYEPSNSTSGNMPGWYAFRVGHWGTKWEPSMISVSFEEGTQWIEPLKNHLLTGDVVVEKMFNSNMEYAEHTMRQKQIILEFDTAWGPPTGIMQELVKQGFRTNHVFMECGADFWGFEWNGREVAAGNMSDYMTDAFGHTYKEWRELAEGAKGKGKKITKTRTINRFNPDNINEPTTEIVAYDEWEIEWEQDDAKSREKAKEIGITDAIWEHVGLEHIRGG